MTYRIFSNDRIVESPTWHNTVEVLPYANDGSSYRVLHAVRNAWRTTLRVSPNDIVILTDTHALSGSLFCLLQRPSHQRPTIVRTDPYIVRPCNRAKAAYLRRTLAPVDALIVWAPAITDRYHRELGITREKMIVERFHHTLAGYSVDAALQTGDYIFAGGDSMRDYKTLFAAVTGLDVKVRVATRLQLGAVPANVTAGPVSSSEFRALMAGARFVVMPLDTSHLRTTGQQSFLNAMVMGKAVIVTDTDDAPYYIDAYRTGVITPSGDAQALRQAITRLLADPSLCTRIGTAAHQAAAPLDQEYTWSRVLKHAIAVHERRLALHAGNTVPMQATSNDEVRKAACQSANR